MFAMVCCGRSYGNQGCRMENEAVIAVTRQVPSDVDVIAFQDGFLAAWSTADSTSFARLDIRGRAVSGVERVQLGGYPEPRQGQAHRDIASKKTFWPASERPSVGAEDIQLVSAGDGKAVLFMLALAGNGSLGGAYAALIDPHHLGEVRAVRVGSAGEYATRISGVRADSGLVAVWHDGGFASSKLRLARLDPASLSVEKRNLLEGKGAVASPVLLRSDGQTVLAWSETETRGGGPASLINTAVVSSTLDIGAISTVAESGFLYPSPDMAVMGDRIGLTFRDDADRDETPEYHLALLRADGTPLSERARISQADGYRGPSLAVSDGTFLGATVRSFQRNLLIGLNRFDQKGNKLGGEFQVYADKTDFVRVDISENKNTLLLVYAEDQRSSGRILAGQVMCMDER
jgi:hypothetical protein